jgi:altronate dehydratase small subunit
MEKIIHFSDRDNLATSLTHLIPGEVITVGGETIIVLTDIPQFHKISLADIPAGGDVYKYGEIIGKATKDIRKGDLAHVHNIESMRGRGDRA